MDIYVSLDHMISVFPQNTHGGMMGNTSSILGLLGECNGKINLPFGDGYFTTQKNCDFGNGSYHILAVHPSGESPSPVVISPPQPGVNVVSLW